MRIANRRVSGLVTVLTAVALVTAPAVANADPADPTTTTPTETTEPSTPSEPAETPEPSTSTEEPPTPTETPAVPAEPADAQATGTVFDDKNGNGSADAGEGLAGVGLTWTSTADDTYSRGTQTGQAGAFELALAPGTYTVTGGAYDYLIKPRTVTVPESGVDGVLILARPRLLDLAVDIEFTKDTYAPTESPTVHIVLTNKGDRAAPGIGATCYHSTDHPDLTGDGISDVEVTVAAHDTAVIEFIEAMPALAYQHGYVAVSCRFGYVDLPNADAYPIDSDYATVPGRLVDLSGTVQSDVDQTPFAGVRVALAGVDGCPIVADTRTDAAGRFQLKGVQVGRYYLYVVLPPGWAIPGWWKPRPTTLVIDNWKNITLSAHPYDNPTVYAPPDCPGGPNVPVPQGSAAPSLAQTGARTVVPGIVGLLMVLAGAGAVALSRRRDIKRG